MGTLVYFDCFSGASGDMVLGALLDAGLPLDALREALGSLTIDGCTVTAAKVSRASVAATKFSVLDDDGPRASAGHDAASASHRHGHGPGHDDASRSHTHHHYSLATIDSRIAASNLSATARTRARSMFRRLAEAEAEIHQTTIDRVHLHEVGALDSIIDIVGAAFAFEWFGADVVMASPLNVGSGTVTCAHGTFPVPAPATVKLLEGVPIYARGVPGELVTPTGALLMTEYASRFGDLPPLAVSRVGYGAGDRNPAGAPNVLRVYVGETSDGGGRGHVVSIQFEIDDMNPQLFGPLMDRLYETGALEVMYSPVQMKKNRPGTLVTIIADPDRRETIFDLVFCETTTLGVRYQELRRECLEREAIEVRTSVGPVRIKVARRNGAVVNAAPEFDDLALLATRSGLSIKELQALAMRAYLDVRSPTSHSTETAVTEPLEPTANSPVVPATPVAASSPALEASKVTIDEFMKIELRVAKVLSAERVPNSRKLIKMEVDLGSEQRIVVGGLAGAYEPENLVGRTVVVVANLQPAKLMGIESNGMILAASLEGGAPALVGFDQLIPPGTRVR